MQNTIRLKLNLILALLGLVTSMNEDEGNSCEHVMEEKQDKD